jgi:hypothetical protein
MSLLAAKRANVAEPDQMLEQERAEILAGLKAKQKRI